MIDYYPDFTNLLSQSIEDGNLIERLSVQKASLLLYPSEWAAQSAAENYHADREKIHIVPFGANLESTPDRQTVLQKQKSDRCRLLFVGASWQRKGGDIAFETLLELERLGIPSELFVCGCIHPRGFSHTRMTVIPFLDKTDQRQAKEFEDLFQRSDFLLLPTRSECYGIVFCEANAFGLPAITTYTGGVSGVVRDGENGFMLPLSAKGIDYAMLIYRIYQDHGLYYDMIRSSRAAFDDRLNWNAWAIKVRKLITKMLDQRCDPGTA